MNNPPVVTLDEYTEVKEDTCKSNELALQLMADSVKGQGVGLLHAMMASNVACASSKSAELCAELLKSGLLNNVSLQPSSTTTLENRRSHFIASNLCGLFDPKLGAVDLHIESQLPPIPPLDSFIDLPNHIKKDKFFQDIRVCDIVCGAVNSVDEAGITVRLICTLNQACRDLQQFKLDVFVPMEDLQLDGESVSSVYRRKCYVRMAVKSVFVETHRIFLTTIVEDGTTEIIRLGVIEEEDLPGFYVAATKLTDCSTYDVFIGRNSSFKNPTLTTLLCGRLGLQESYCTTSFLPEFNERSNCSSKFAANEFCSSLRAKQSYKLAMHSVIRGVEQFKKGNKAEALQLYNKALQVDANNVEALVARGALYSSGENFDGGIKDFEQAIVADNKHVNARKYLVETLAAKAKLQLLKRDRHGVKKTCKRIMQLDSHHEFAKKIVGTTETEVVQLDNGKEQKNSQGKSDVNPLELQIKSLCRGSNLKLEKLTQGFSGNEELMDKLKSYCKLYSKTKEEMNGNGESSRKRGNCVSDKSPGSDVIEISPPAKLSKSFDSASMQQNRNKTLKIMEKKEQILTRKDAVVKVKEDRKLEKKLNDMTDFIQKLKSHKK